MPAVETDAEESPESTPLPDMEPGGKPDDEMPSGFHQPVSETETGRMDLEDTDTVSAPEGGGIEEDEKYAGTGYSGAASDIARVLESMAENSVCAELERQRTKELTELAQSISYGNIHDGVSMTVHRMAEVPDALVEQYQEISGDLLHISKQLQKSVLQQLKDSRRGGKQTGLLMGRKLDSHTLYRRDGRVFCKNTRPNEAPALSVGLLLDESGSMCSYERATYARATAIILYDFCQSLGILVMVCGHSASSGVDLYSYYAVLDMKEQFRPGGLTGLNGARPCLNSVEYDEERGFPLAAPEYSEPVPNLRLRQALSRLEPQERQVVVLYLEGERPRRNQRDSFHSALEKLREFYLSQAVTC